MARRDDDSWTQNTKADSRTTAEASAVVEGEAGVWLLVRVHGGRSPIRAAVLAPGLTLVGRAVPEGIPLSDDRSSRVHASLLVDDEGVTVEDHRTRNGTFVDGAKVAKARAGDGSVLRFGDSIFVLRRTSGASLEDHEIPGIVGVSPEARALRRHLAALAGSGAWVLLLGETGVGKEVAARVLHERSGRSGPLVAVNCAALPSELAEAQLFGHTKGAFTGADTARDGYFQAAHGGTLFLDELGELPLALQAKLLRVLDDGVVVRVGETRGRAVDVRVVAATLRDLAQAVQRGEFRADLYSRLAEVVLQLPPLRQRKEDVLLLLSHFLGDDKPITAELAAALLAHPWPFNVREVAKVARELKARGAGMERYELALVQDRLHSSPPPPGKSERSAPPSRDELIALLRDHGGNVVALAHAVNRSRKQVYRWLTDHGVDPAEFRRP